MNAVKVCRVPVFILIVLCKCVDLQNQKVPEEKEEHDSNEMTIDIYRKLLQQKRMEQVAAMKKLMSIDSYDRQYKLVKLLVEKISGVLSENKLALLKLGYTAGDPFPKDENVKDALSMVVENTAFFGDVLLRLPDMVHKLLKGNKEWDLLIKWAVSFVNETHILIKTDLTLLNLMAQELNIVPKDPNYINPFKESIQKEKDKAQKNMEEQMKTLAAKQKKKKKEKHRGPRLQGSRNEL